MRVYFNDTQYIEVVIDTLEDFINWYGEENEGYFLSINRQANQNGGMFGIIFAPDVKHLEHIVRHEAGHAAYHWIRVHGYKVDEEEEILTMQDAIYEAFMKEYRKE